jgi:hypothetical protein
VLTAAHSKQSCLHQHTAPRHWCQLLHTANNVAFNYTLLLFTGANCCTQQTKLHSTTHRYTLQPSAAHKTTLHLSTHTARARKHRQRLVTYRGVGGVQPTEISRSEENKSVKNLIGIRLSLICNFFNFIKNQKTSNKSFL